MKNPKLVPIDNYKEPKVKYYGNVDEFVKYVTTIVSPPTSRTNGQAVAWFNHDSVVRGGYKNPSTGKYETRRTYIMEQTEPINFKATGYTWNEETKISNVTYELEGLEKQK